jgi:hypothetical protein
MDETVQNEQVEQLDLPEYDFTTEEGNGAGAAEAQPQPKPEVKEAVPETGTQSTGYYVRTAAQEYDGYKKQYEELTNRIKQMRDLGYPTDGLEKDALRMEARLAAAEMGLREAQRMDARYRVPAVVDRLLQDVPPDVAGRMRQMMVNALEQAVYQNPSILDDTPVLTAVMQSAYGAVKMEELKRKRPTASPTGSVSSPNPPPNPNPKPTEVPEVAKRFGLNENTWKKVEQLPEGSGWVDLDL